MSYEAEVTEILKEIKKLNAGMNEKNKKITINKDRHKILYEGIKETQK